MESIITPLPRIQRIGSVFETEDAGASQVAGTEAKTGIFQDILQTAMENVAVTDSTAVNDTEKLATGDVDDVHQLGIDNYEASLAVSMLVQIRNRALESYNQIMQTTV
ncbi:MAG: flagellar hook-basal body complex protein FliE [Anaerovoracaceae bacterium]